MLKNKTRKFWMGIFLASFVVVGIGTSTYSGDILRSRAVKTWQDAAEADADRLTETILVRMAQAKAELRAIALAFQSRKISTPVEFESLIEEIEAWELEEAFESIAYAQLIQRSERQYFENSVGKALTVLGKPTETAPEIFESFAVRFSSDAKGFLRPNADLATHIATNIVATTAYRTPGKVILGPAFEDNTGHHHLLIGIAAEQGSRRGVFVATFNLKEFFDGLASFHAPIGLRLRFSERDNTEARAENLFILIIGSLRPPSGTIKTYLKRITLGQARWELNWDLHADYLGGPKIGFATALQVGGSFFTLLVAGLISFLSLQNLRTQQIVTERTAALQNEVSERIRTELGLQRSEERFRDFASATSDWFWEMDENLRFSYFSDRFSEISGVTQKDLLGKTRQESSLNIKDEQVRRNIEDLKAHRPFKNFEHSRTRPDGSIVHMSTSGMPVFDKDGAFLGYRGTGTDVTERKQAGEQLKMVINSMPEGFAHYDADDRLVVVNAKMADTYPLLADMFVPGVTFEEVVRMGVERGQFGPDDGQDAEEWIQKKLAYHRDPKGAIEFNLPDGRTVRVEEKRTPDGGIVGVRTDITELKKIEQELRIAHENLEQRVKERTAELGESEARFKDLYDNAPDMYISIDPQSAKVIQCNQTLMTTLGYSKDEIIGQPVTKFYHPDSMEKFKECFQSFATTGKAESDELQLKRKDGSRIDVSLRVSAVRDETGKILHSRSVWRDITERKQAEEARQEVEQRFRALVDNSPAAILLKDADGKYLLANRQWHQWFNPKDRDIAGKTVYDFYPKEHADSVTAQDREVIKTSTVVLKEYLMPLADGIPKITMLNKFPVVDDNGKIIAIGGVHTDISELKEIETELLEQKNRLQTALDNMTGGLFIFDKDLRIQVASPGLQKFYGFPAEMVVPGASAIDLMKLRIERGDYGPGDPDELLAKRIESYKKREPATVEDKTPNGRLMDLRISPLPDGGTVGVFNDITERKRAEEALKESESKLREILENSPIGVAIVTHDVEDGGKKGKRLFVNSSFIHMFGGATHRQMIEGKIFDSWVDPERHLAAEKIMRNNDELVDFEAQRRRMDGTEWWVSMHSRPIRFDGQDCTMVWHFDITDRLRSEDQLRQSQKMEAVGQLTGGVAHDFNNLLAVISGNLEFAAEASGMDEDTREMLFQALAAVDKGAGLTDQLLTFSRQQTLNPKTIEANSLLFDMINLLMRTLGEDIDIKTAFDEQIPLIKVDTAMLGNAILNMALNARDAMPGGGTLTVKTAGVDLDGEVLDDDQNPLTGSHLLISVSDTGTGINKKDLDHVFEPFFTTKSIGKGTGLGLSMVFGFAKQSGGHVTIDSKIGQGTTVNLYFPATDSPDVENKEESATEPKAEPICTETILVVEDDADVRKVTLNMLNRLGYVVLEAEDGPSALDTLQVLEDRGVGVDLVFSDVIMPSGMSGYDLANELRSRYRDIKVLMTSGYPEKVIDKGENNGSGITLLKKPYKKTDLAAAVRGALDQKNPASRVLRIGLHPLNGPVQQISANRRRRTFTQTL